MQRTHHSKSRERSFTGRRSSEWKSLEVEKRLKGRKKAVWRKFTEQEKR